MIKGALLVAVIALGASGEREAILRSHLLSVNEIFERRNVPFAEDVPIFNHASINHSNGPIDDGVVNFSFERARELPFYIWRLSRKNVDYALVGSLAEPYFHVVGRCVHFHEQSRQAPDAQGWRLSRILDFDAKSRGHAASKSLSLDFNESDIGAQLSLRGLFREGVLSFHQASGPTGVLHGLAGQSDLLVKENGADCRDNGGEGRDQHHPKRPNRHRLLGSEIALFVVLAAGGLWVSYRAFGWAGDARNIGKTLAWTAVLCGAGVTAAYSLILLLMGGV